METINYSTQYTQNRGDTRAIADEILAGLRQISDDSQLAEHLVLYHDRLAEWQSPHKKESLTELVNTLKEAVNDDSGIEVVRRIMMIIAFTYLAFPDDTEKNIADGILSILASGNNAHSVAGLIDRMNQIISKA